jgi:hypothetical protein
MAGIIDLPVSRKWSPWLRKPTGESSRPMSNSEFRIVAYGLYKESLAGLLVDDEKANPGAPVLLHLWSGYGRKCTEEYAKMLGVDFADINTRCLQNMDIVALKRRFIMNAEYVPVDEIDEFCEILYLVQEHKFQVFMLPE